MTEIKSISYATDYSAKDNVNQIRRKNNVLFTLNLHQLVLHLGSNEGLTTSKRCSLLHYYQIDFFEEIDKQ